MSESEDNLTFELHDELNPRIWDGPIIYPEIKDRLLEIAEAFLDYIDTDIEVEDILLTGSLANYNYTKYSDFDVHIVTDFKIYDADLDMIKDYFNAKKTVWNTTRNIKVRGYNVELYIQDTAEAHHSTGVYSLKNDEWIKEPKTITDKSQIDKSLIIKKKEAMIDIINYALSDECDADCAAQAKEKFMNLRKAGLEAGGEFAPENLAFKELRRSGDIERLMKGIIAKKDKVLSLDSVNENFKEFMGIGSGNKRGPRHQSPLAGMNKLNNPEAKSIGMVAQMHKIDELPAIHRLKKQAHGYVVVPPDTANKLATEYNLDMGKIRSGQPRALSTSGISLGYDQVSNCYFLRK